MTFLLLYLPSPLNLPKFLHMTSRKSNEVSLKILPNKIYNSTEIVNSCVYLITCISNPYFRHNKLILMLNLCNYDACYHSFMTFSSLACHFTKVHIFVVFKVNYIFY